MDKSWSFSVARLAIFCIRLSIRWKSNGARPSTPLGSRILTNPDDVFKHNMWDHVEWTKEEKENAQHKAKENSSVKVPLEEQGKFDLDACQYWDKFYEIHQDKFFKDRKWLFLEFPELLAPSPQAWDTNTCHSDEQLIIPLESGSKTGIEMGNYQCHGPFRGARETDNITQEPNENVTLASSFPGQHASFRMMEVGCGVGNSVFPIINTIKGTNSFLYCCDFSPRAIRLVKAHPEYDNSVCHAFIHDICKEVASFPFPPQSLDVILAVFVLSSIHPERLQGVVNRLSTYLKPGGIFLFRDYGRHDFSQLRFKRGRCLSENFYTRGDGTCVYFFTKDDVHSLFSRAGLEEIMNLEDKRLQVNRGKKVTMHRVWMQSKYRKPLSNSE